MKMWIVAVSGGVDSMVLLDMLVNKALDAELVVAHVDHGIRPESGEDAAFVRTCAKMYNLPFESIRLGLGAGASEERARKERWQFLRAMREKYQADKIATAHHADDVVETMIINLLRGTGWRGIASLRETDEILRPLIAMRKRDIVAYAREHQLSWREDATNADQTYLRNRVRHTIMPRLNDEQVREWLDMHVAQCAIRAEIEQEIASGGKVTRRYLYSMWPDDAAREMLQAQIGSLTRRESDRALLFIRTARPSKRLQLSNGKVLEMKPHEFIVSDRED